MAKSPLILAALAIDAVPGINFTDVKPLTSGANGAFDTAILTTDKGEHFVIRIAETAAAGTEQEVELHALKALEAVRDRLPFKIGRLIGETKDARGKRALVFEYLYGNSIDVTRVTPGGHLAENIGKALAAIHNIPTSVVDEAGLPSFEPAQLVRARVAEVDRAAATGKVPPVLLSRWESALEDAELFRYLPTVIHGGLNGETVLEHEDEVSGVLSWSTLRVSDPAEDFAWIFGAGLTELADAVLFSYSIDRQLSDPSIRKRAALYSELDMARWLLHGVSKNEAEIVEDAESMLKQLAEDLNEGKLLPLSSVAFAAVAHEDSFIAAGAADDAFTSAGAPDDSFVAEGAANLFESAPIENDAADFDSVATAAIEIVSVEETEEISVDAEGNADVTEEITIVTAEPVDNKTRVIELPDKSENELF